LGVRGGVIWLYGAFVCEDNDCDEVRIVFLDAPEELRLLRLFGRLESLCTMSIFTAVIVSVIELNYVNKDMLWSCPEICLLDKG